ncbi:MAG: PQQ-binding-like beta-propeller repeat protein [Sedimentisphaerales bacterium]|nr:PQQ-binding-like beta-propeller repeat protein [Sedimentisphaerales bacterium]
MCKSRLSRWVFTGVVVISLAAGGVCRGGDNWPRFRGPNGQGIAGSLRIPARWTENDYNWKVTLPGTGYSSPVVWGDKVFITCADQDAAKGKLLALSVADGRTLWDKEFAFKPYRMNRINSYAAGTAALDAENVYSVWATSGQILVTAFDHGGKEVWSRTFDGVKSQHGPCSSPIVVGDLVVFTQEHENSGNTPPRSFWYALDRKTGQTRWDVARQTGPKTSYSTPCIYPSATGKAPIIFTSRSHGITAVAASTGKIVWEAESAFTSRVVSSPVIADKLVLGTCGDGSAGKYIIAVAPNETAEPDQAYKIEGSSASYVPTPLAVNGLLFTFHDRGQVSCLRADTGEMLWQEKPAGRYYGSPVWANGRIYCIDTDGQVVVIKAASEYKLLAVNPLGENSQATPAIADGRMYLRTDSHLISIGPGD